MTAVRIITVKAFDGEKLTVGGFEGEEFEDVEWAKQGGISIEPKVGSKGLAVQIGGSAERLTVIAIYDHADDGPVSLYDARGNKVELGVDGIVMEGQGQKVELLSTGIKISSPSKVEINAPQVFINDILQSGD